MLVLGLLLTLCPSPPLPEEEQAALPHCCHHQLPGPLCFSGGPPRGLCPLHAPAVSDKPAAVFLRGHLRQGCTQLLCFAISSPTATALQAGGIILPVSGLIFFCCFFKAPGYRGRVSSLVPSTSWSFSCPPHPGHGPNRDTQLHKQRCTQSPCSDGALFHPSPGASGA